MSHNENSFPVPALRSLWWSRLVRRFADKLEIPQAAMCVDEAPPLSGPQASVSGDFSDCGPEA